MMGCRMCGRWLAAVAAGVVAACSAPAPGAAPGMEAEATWSPGPGPGGSGAPVHGGLRIVHPAGTVVAGGPAGLWDPSFETAHPPLEPEIAVLPQEGGCDIAYTFRNTGPGPRSLGSLRVPGIRFGRAVRIRDFFTDGKSVAIDHGGQPYAGGGLVYPGASYSPVWVLSDVNYTVGVSLQYPMTEYRHRVYIRAEAAGDPAGPGGLSWRVKFDLNPAFRIGALEPFSPEGELAPGEERRYVVSVRVLKHFAGQHPGEWLRTLDPYRRWFQSTFGPVQYARDPRPVVGVHLAMGEAIGPDNPHGFIHASRRPDVWGWGPWVSHLQTLHASGYGRFMLWTPTGLRATHREDNYPFQFTSQWQAMPRVRDTLTALANFPNAARELGLWWGNSARLMRGWDTPDVAPLDPDDPAHRAAAFAESDGAAGVGARLVGLDAATLMPEWRLAGWLRALQQRHPEIRFVVEPTACDVLHRLAPTFIYGTRGPEQDQLELRGPHALADFLLPGHEFWAVIEEAHIQADLGYPISRRLTDAEVQTYVARFAAWGYVPVPYSVARLEAPLARFDAAPSWRATVPPDLGAEPPLAILRQPPAAVAAGPGRVAIGVLVSSAEPVEYEWRKDGAPLADSPRVAGARSATLVIRQTTATDAGRYDVVIRSSAAAAQSSACVVGEPGPPPCLADVASIGGSPPRDGALTVDDYTTFINAFAAESLLADITAIGGAGPPDGLLTVDDYTSFINAIANDCQ